MIDLRNNPGGLLDQAVLVSDAFLEKGEIVSTRGRIKENAQRFHAQPGDITEGLPIVVLINSGSASASEIVAGALQDHRRAIILGVKSFGKGSVQTIIPLARDGAIKLTTQRYFTPSGISIQARGINPDIEVEQIIIKSKADLNQRKRHEADLRGALDTEKLKSKSPNSDKKIKNKSKNLMPKQNMNFSDYQLARALDLLRGLSLYDERIKK